MSAASPTKRNAVIAFVMASSVLLYVLGSPAWVFAIAAFLIAAFLLGQYYRRTPNLKVNRVAYIGLGACWGGLAIFFGLSALFIRTGMLPPTLGEELTFIVVSVAAGGAIGDWVGRRRGYVAPNLP